MKRILKVIGMAVLLIVLSPFLLLGGYLVVVCVPKLNDIGVRIEASSIEDRNASENTRKLIKASIGDDFRLYSYVASQLMYKYQREKDGFVKARHFQWVGWLTFAELFLNDDEIYALFSASIYNGSGHGLNELALRLFSKPLSELTFEQLAEVVAVTKAPSYMLARPERLQAARDTLLKKVRENAYNADSL
ncbi:MAG: hypothetical protein EBU46_13240 [Nitrosomonadaceae bacterium]|nr:hypothetical protein [Nitrosomonadaceae bacterium]